MAMTEAQLCGLIDHISDHLMHFGCFPGEHEFDNGYIMDVAEYMPLLEQQAPAFCRMAAGYLHYAEEE